MSRRTRRATLAEIRQDRDLLAGRLDTATARAVRAEADLLATQMVAARLQRDVWALQGRPPIVVVADAEALVRDAMAGIDQAIARELEAGMS